MTTGNFVPEAVFSFPYNLSQNFDILNNFMSGGSYSLISVNLGQSSNPEVEREILAVASYGKQLGRIGDALAVLMAHFKPATALSEKDEEALFALKSLLFEIGEAKKAALKKSSREN